SKTAAEVLASFPPLTRALGSEYSPWRSGDSGENDAHITACGDSSLSARWTRHAGSDRTFFVQPLLGPRYHCFPFCPHRAQAPGQADLDHPRPQGSASLRDDWRRLAHPAPHGTAGRGPWTGTALAGATPSLLRAPAGI